MMRESALFGTRQFPTGVFTCLPARRSRPELFDSAFRFDAIPIRAKTGIDTALVSRTGTATKPAAATYKRTNRQTAQAAGRGRWEAKQGREAGPQIGLVTLTQ